MGKQCDSCFPEATHESGKFASEPAASYELSAEQENHGHAAHGSVPFFPHEQPTSLRHQLKSHVPIFLKSARHAVHQDPRESEQ